jgi:probable rRNA maturation factor
MRELNKTYRRMDKTTDVLSFPQDVTNLTLDLNAAIAFENKNRTLILGDIFISVDTAKKHSAIHRKSIEEEIDKLIIHGILHLLGYDHKKKSDANLMREKENELLSLVESI